MRLLIVFAVALLVPLPRLAASTNYFEAAVEAWKAHDTTNALQLISAAIKESPKEPRYWHERAQMESIMGNQEKAEADFSEAIMRGPQFPYLVVERGMVRFRLGRLTEALIDFDRANEIEPRLQPQNWQRGIALYYAGRYADGRRQFEAHSKVNPEDVENAVWLFMCVARQENMEAARKSILPLGDDGRVPMKEIYQLFAGKGTREDVANAAKAPASDPAEQRRHVFYALLYLALYDDLDSQRDAAIDKLAQAVRLAEPGDYMGAVAAFHLNRLREQPAAAPAAPPATPPVSPTPAGETSAKPAPQP